MTFFDVHSILEADFLKFVFDSSALRENCAPINKVTERFEAADVMKLAARSLSPRRVIAIDTRLMTG